MFASWLPAASSVLGDLVWAGCANGNVAELQLPYATDADSSRATVLPLHQSAVTAVEVSAHNLFLFTCSEDGSIFLTAMTKAVDRALRALPHSAVQADVGSPAVADRNPVYARCAQVLSLAGAMDSLLLVHESLLQTMQSQLEQQQADAAEKLRSVYNELTSKLAAVEAARAEENKEHTLSLRVRLYEK